MAVVAVVSVSMGVMKPVLAKLTTLMSDEYKKIKGLPKDVAFFQRELSDMAALLERMDNADELNPQARKWRSDIIEMTYNIEDRIDDFMHSVGEANGKVHIIQKASQYLGTFKDRHRLANQFQEIKTQVMEASERRKRYMLDQCIDISTGNPLAPNSITTPVVYDPRLATLYTESTSLVGINNQKEDLVKWVINERKELMVMAIVGAGGLGKTTLANEVYREVGAQFDCKAFVSVSQKPEIIRLLNSLLLQLGLGPYSQACNVQDRVNDLRGHLHDKRYFIIVDDLWDTRAWDTIQCAFPPNNQRSRVIITTRNKTVARSCCHKHGSIYNMRPLCEKESRKLFLNRIFGSEDACPSELATISSEILNKCGGLPLAIITLASMFACQSTRLEGQWEYVRNSLATKVVTNSNYEDMMYILDISYKNLPHHLKACFLYLGSYPEDYEISRDELVRRWVAEGFVSNSFGQDIWDVAESYFIELVNRSMIQPTYMEYNIEVSGCRVHDILLELIIRRCEEDNFLSVVNNPQAVAETQQKIIRRLTVVGQRGIDNFTVGKLQPHIRSLTILGESNWVPPLLDFMFVRVLFLQISWGVKMDLTSISQLSQLRYLKVEGKVVLSGQIQGLQILETLDLSGISSCRVQLEVVDAPRLCHLVVPMGQRLPDWIVKVKSLRTLCGFSLPTESFGSIIGLGELSALSYLTLYFPRGCTPLLKEEWKTALGTSLQKLSNLKHLYVWHEDPVSVALCIDGLISLVPPFHNLEWLDTRICTFSRVPRWISHLQNLRVLSLGTKDILQEDVAMIGTQLLSLVALTLRISPDVPARRIAIGGSTGFPIVKWFQLDCNWMSFLTFEVGAMPELRELELVFDADEWDRAAPSGLQHLPRLEKIEAWRACYDSASEDEEKAEAMLIKDVFHKTTKDLPTRPAFIFGRGWQIRPTEED